MSVCKVSLLLIAWASYYYAYTSPKSPAPAESQSSSQTIGSSFAGIFRNSPSSSQMRAILQKIFVSGLMLLEMAFASDIPSLRKLLPNATTSLHQPSFISPSFLLGVACALSGALVRLWSYRVMGAQFTFHLSLLKDHKLITTGPYAYVRHPSYTALIMTVAGIFICELSSGSWYTEARVFYSALGKIIALLAGCCVVIVLSVASRATKEDKFLSENFGQEWKEWEKRVPYRFIPGIL